MTDFHGHRLRIGIAVPSTNTTVQPECERLRPPGVTNHTGRVSIRQRRITTEKDFLEHVQAMRDGMGGAIDRVASAQVDHIIMGVALEAFWGGVAQAAELQDSLAKRAGVGVSMGSTATAAALKAFGIKRIAVLTPHLPRGDEQVRDYFAEAGFDVLRLIGLKRPSPIEIAHTTGAEMRSAIRQLDGHDAEAIVQVGTNLPAMDICAEAERWLGKPVLAINAVTYWDALRRSGIEDRIHGHGRILEDH
ncbi:MAG: Asp/Glu racemase [Gammaproteobacteria bacterium]|nr:Asp/Glu racemase [Gammaproteobacteria bacterium]MCY4165537.1 Asp/Glu racemase [Gammaproteobacteria bacterium]MCY4254773.1 Asp/Glu racemase [Gammaproteobacteria bacterium]MCY4340481.1 Asp/Glu racemase [Gammaproteobacteria bacterium]